jgi:ribosomal protein S18 acetylase RimI-like enzyme
MPSIPLSSYTWRPAERGDLAGIHALLGATHAASGNSRVPSLADLEREFDDPWSPPAANSRLALAPDGTVAALGRLYANPNPEEISRAWMDVELHPTYRDQALEDSLMGWLAARGSARLAEIAADTGFRGPRMLRTGCDEQASADRALLERHGFQPARYFYRMRRDLSQPIPDRPLPAGLSLSDYQPALAERLRQALNEAFADHWQPEYVTVDDWQMFFVQHSTFRPDLTRVVLDGDEVAAFSLSRLDEAENARQGYTTGWVWSLGTRRAWRKRGLASCLLVEAMRAFQAQGLQFATLGVDAENLTGALGLYEKLGFVTFRTSMAYIKDLPAGEAEA